MAGNLYMILLLVAIFYVYPAPKPLDILNINLKIGDTPSSNQGPSDYYASASEKESKAESNSNRNNNNGKNNINYNIADKNGNENIGDSNGNDNVGEANGNQNLGNDNGSDGYDYEQDTNGSDYQDQECSCNNFINHHGYGQCKKKHRKFGGSAFCYVNLPSNCNDLIESRTNPGKFMSASACSYECSCTTFINNHGYGQCKKKHRKFGGSPFCYVNLPSICNDLIESRTNPGKFMSASACSIGCSSFSKNVESLSSAQTANLMEAMRNLHASSNWERVASMHGEPVRRECGFRLCCIHKVSGFLPWHRAHMDSFNSALGTAIPYWDWTISSFPSIANSGPFSHGLQVFNGRSTDRSTSSISTKGNLDAVLAALEEDDFVLFSTQLNDIHQAIHSRIGGSMKRLGIAAYDPIFYLHHTFVDLVWAVYQVLKPNVQEVNLGQRLIPFGRTIGSTLSTNCYNLDINNNRIVFGGMTLAQIQNRISSRTQESGVQVEDRVYAGFIKRSFGTSGIIKFNICNEDDCSYPGGEVNIFGDSNEMPYINSDPTKVDITDAVNKAGIDNINQLKFKIMSFTNLNGRQIRKKMYTPIRIVRPGNGKRNLNGTGSNESYCIFFNRNSIQPPKLRIPKNTIFEVDSPYQNIIETTNRNSYINCNKTNGTPQPSKTPINVNPGIYYFFDDDCKTQPTFVISDFSDKRAMLMNYVSKLQIVKE